MSEHTGAVELRIEGMTCPECATHVSASLAAVEGVVSVEVSYPKGTASARVDGPVTASALSAALEGTSYSASPASETTLRSVEAAATPSTCDLAVLGGGAAGFAAAIRGAELGARVVMVHHGVLGGTCVNVGCVPSKTLIRAAEVRHRQGHHGFDGIQRSVGPADWSAVRAAKDQLVASMRASKYESVLEAYPEINLVSGRGAFDRDGVLHLSDGTSVPASKIVITTGSSPRVPDVPGVAEAGCLDSTSLLDLDELPESMLVLGAGPVGVELAQAYARLGVAVTIAARSRLLSDEDPEVGSELEYHLRAEGLTVLTGVEPVSVEGDSTGRRVELRDWKGDTRALETRAVLVAAGRVPNTSGLGLDGVGIDIGEAGEIVVDEHLRTSNPRVYAAGDVIGGEMHVYVAAHAAKLAAENALGSAKPLDLAVLPRVTFTDPAVASVGMTEHEARQDGTEPLVSKIALGHVSRALAARDTRGFVKLVAEPGSRRILGAHIVAAEAGEMIMEPALAIRHGLTIDDLASALHPYLTLAEAIKIAALAFDKDVSKLSCCAV